MDKEKISKAICILVIVILFFAGASRFLSSGSMTLKEYAEQKAAETTQQQ